MMYKILHTADWHVGRTNHSIITSTGVHTKFLDSKKSTDQITNIIKEQSINIVVFSGDWAQINKPNPQYNSAVIEILHEWEDEIDLLIWISGNHTSSPSTNYNAVSTLKSAFQKTKHYHFFYDKNINSVEYKDINFVCVPHTNELRSRGASEFESIIQKSSELIKQDKINILTSHFPLSDAIDIPDDTKFKSENLNFKLLDKFFLKFDLVMLGDIHKAQKLGKNVFYSGSIIQNTFAEENEKKGVYIYDIDSTEKTWQDSFFETKSREYKTLKFKKFDEYQNHNAQQLKDTILRIKLDVDSIQQIIKYDRIYQEYFSECLFVIPDFTLVSDNIKIASLTGADYKQALINYIEEKYKDDPDKDVLLKEATETLDKIQEAKQYDF